MNQRENEELDRASREELERLLDDAAREERREREEAERLRTAPGLTRVDRVLEETWAERKSSPNRPWRLRLIVFAAAAALLAWLLIGRGEAPKSSSGPEMLGDEKFRVIAPQSVVEEWPEAIEWFSAEPLSYQVSVLNPESNETVFGPVTTMDTKLVIPKEEMRTWPKRIRIVFKFRQPDGEERPPATHDAELAP